MGSHRTEEGAMRPQTIAAEVPRIQNAFKSLRGGKVSEFISTSWDCFIHEFYVPVDREKNTHLMENHEWTSENPKPRFQAPGAFARASVPRRPRDYVVNPRYRRPDPTTVQKPTDERLKLIE